MPDVISPSSEDWKNLLSSVKDCLSDAVAKKVNEDWDELKSLSRKMECPEAHILCCLAALTGEVCHSVNGTLDSIADSVAAAAKEKYGRIAAAVAKAATKKAIKVVKAANPVFAQVEALGMACDLLAMDLCPRPPEHPEVLECEKRVAGRLAKDVSHELLDQWTRKWLPDGAGAA